MTGAPRKKEKPIPKPPERFGWPKLKILLGFMSVFMLSTHVYYSLFVVDSPLYGDTFRFDYEVVNGHEVASITPAQLQENLTLQRNSTAAFARFANYTVPPPRTLYEGDVAREVPYVVTTRVHLAVADKSQLEFEVLVAGARVGAGTGQGDYTLPPNVKLRFADFESFEVRARNLGNVTMVNASLFVSYENSKFYAPNAMRILFIHAPSAWVGYLGYGVVLGGSLLALRRPKWEAWAAAGVELAILFSAIALITGPVWASEEWGVPWRWEDVKLFVTLVMFLTLLGFVSIRAGIDDPAMRRRVSAYYAAVSFITVPMSYLANRIWVRYHPAIIDNPQGAVSDAILGQMGFGMVALTLLFLLLLGIRVRQLREKEAQAGAKERVELGEGDLVADLPVVVEEEKAGEEDDPRGANR